MICLMHCLLNIRHAVLVRLMQSASVRAAFGLWALNRIDRVSEATGNWKYEPNHVLLAEHWGLTGMWMETQEVREEDNDVGTASERQRYIPRSDRSVHVLIQLALCTSACVGMCVICEWVPCTAGLIKRLWNVRSSVQIGAGTHGMLNSASLHKGLLIWCQTHSQTAGIGRRPKVFPFSL